MTTRAAALLVAAAAAYLAGSLPLVVAPVEVLQAIGQAPSPPAALAAQVAGVEPRPVVG